MGYNTTFMGTLLFAQPLSVMQYHALTKLLGAECEDHPEWQAPCHLWAIDLEVSEQALGLRWNGSKTTAHLDELVNLLLRQMRTRWPAFGLRGQLLAQGEEPTDRWTLIMGMDGWAHRAPGRAPGRAVQCPQCAHTFFLEE